MSSLYPVGVTNGCTKFHVNPPLRYFSLVQNVSANNVLKTPDDKSCIWVLLKCYLIFWKLYLKTQTHRCLTHDAVCAIGGGGARGGAVVVSTAPTASTSVEAGHGRKAGADICRRVWRVALRKNDRTRWHQHTCDRWQEKLQALMENTKPLHGIITQSS